MLQMAFLFETALKVAGDECFALPESERPVVAARALLGASASMLVQKCGLTPQQVADHLEAFAARLRSGEAGATAVAVLNLLLGRGGPPS